MFRRVALLLVLSASLAGAPCFGEEPPSVTLPVVTTAPVIDGVMNGDEWKEATRVELPFQVEPGDNSTPSERTEAFVCRSQDHLYIAFHAHDKTPSAIRARVSKRDNISEDDYVTLMLDTYNDRQRAYVFSVNPLGAQADGFYLSEQGIDYTWDGIFDSKAVVTNDGYVVEMAIPFKTLRFKSGKDARWGIFLRRWIARNSERTSSVRISRDVSGFLLQMATLDGLDDIRAGRTLDITPTLVGTNTGERLPPDGRVNSVNKLDPGLTVTFSPTPNVTVTATANPDFSQVEADVPQINVNQRFALFFPERRQFFLEGAEFFQPSMGDFLNLVNTRTIVDPDWGLKITGKIGRNTFGFLTASDRAAGRRLEPGDPDFGKNAQFTVARYRRDFFKDSTVGAFFTNTRFAGSSNTALSVDARVRIRPDTNIGGQFVQTSTRGKEGISTGGRSYTLKYDQYGRNWRIFGTEQKVDADFRNDVGFIDRTGYHAQSLEVGYAFQPKDDKSWWSLFWPFATAYRSRTPDGFPELQNISLAFDFNLRRGIETSYSYSINRDGFAGRILPYRQQNFFVAVTRFKRVSYSGVVSTGGGINYDPVNPSVGDSLFLRQTVTVRPTNRINSEFLYLKSSLKNRANGARFFNQDILRNRTVFQITQNLAIRSILDYDTSQRRIGVSVLGSYTPRPGTSIYLGYDSLLFNGLDPLTNRRTAGLFRQRATLFFKLSYTFRF